MKFNLLRKFWISPREITNRQKVKSVLNQLRDWLNHQAEDQYEGCQRIEERILQQRLKYEGYRFPYMF